MNLTKIDLSELENQNAAVAKRLENVIFRAFQLGAVEGAQRLSFVGKQFKRLTVDEAYHFINPDDIIHEVEEAQARKIGVGGLHVARNAIGILPLLCTWIALLTAAIGYQQDLANPKYSADQFQPFLRLWQDGFHGTTWLTFSFAAGADVCLLLIYISFIIFVPVRERKARKKAEQFFTDVQTTTDELLDVVGTAGVNPLTTDNDIDKIVKALTRVIQSTMLNSDNVAKKAQDLIADTASRIDTVFTHFDSDLATFNADLKLLTSDLTNLGTDLRGHNQQVKDLTDASTKLAGASSSLTTSAQEMATSATANAAASSAIGGQLGTLNTTQQEIIQTQKDVVKEIADTQKDVVTGINDAADKMDVVAMDTKQVAKELGQITKADLQTMTDKVSDAAGQVTLFAQGLSQINAQMQATVNDLQIAARALASSAGRGRQHQANQQLQQLQQQLYQQQQQLYQQQNQQPFNQQQQQPVPPPVPQPQQLIVPPKKSLFQRIRSLIP